MGDGRRRREAVSLARQGLLIAKRAAKRRRTRSASFEDERAVVFVHGFMAAGAVFDPIRDRVEQELRLPTSTVTYGSYKRFETIVDALEKHIAESPARRVSLVGHSLGGLVCRWMVQHVSSSRVDRLITLATPHGGTRAARFAPGRLGAALRPGSELLRALGDRPVEVPHLAVVAGQDRMVTPPASAAQVEGADVVWIDDMGHNSMLFDDRVHRLVVDRLR